MALDVSVLSREFLVSSELRTLLFSGITSEELSVSIYTPLYGVIYENSYVPDFNGVVTVFGINDILTRFMPQGFGDFTFKIVGQTTIERTVTVLKCDAGVTLPSETFVDNFFLTAFFGIKDTAIGFHELLSVFNRVEEEVISCTCDYVDENGFVFSVIRDLTRNRGLLTLDVSPAQFFRQDAQLIGYTVKCGHRKALYRVMDLPTPDPSVMFKNSFGVWETVNFMGAKETIFEYKRGNAVANGVFINYKSEETQKIKVSTGFVKAGAIALVSDLCRSRSVFIIGEDGTPTAELAVLEDDVKFTNEGHTLMSASVTFRYGDVCSARIERTLPPRLFDDSFDVTYE